MIDRSLNLEALNDLLEGDHQLSHAVKLEAIEQRLGEIKVLENKSLYARTMLNYAKELYSVGRNENAREIALDIYQVTFNNALHEQHMLCCNVLGNLSARVGFYALALDYYHQSLNIMDHHPIRKNYRSTLINNIASLYASLKLYDSAIKYYAEALKLAEQEGNTETQFLIYYNMGDIYARGNECHELKTVKFLIQAMIKATCQQVFHKGLYALICSKYERISGNYQSALEHLESIPKFLEVEEDPITRIEYYLERALNLEFLKDYNDSFEQAELAYKSVIKSGEFEFEREVLAQLCRLTRLMGDSDKIIYYQQKLINTDEEFINRMNEMTIYQIKEKSVLNIEEKLNKNALKLLKDMQLVYNISREITREQDYDKIFSLIIEKLLSFLDFDALVIGLYDSSLKTIYNRMMYHDGEITRSFDVNIKNKSSLAAWTIRHKQEIYTGFNSHLRLEDFEPLHMNFPDLEVPYESVFYIPLFNEDEVIAVFSLQKFERDGFDHYELEMIRAISTYLSVAIANALKTQELKRLNHELGLISLKDSLSGLFNRFALNIDLEHFFSKEVREKSNISALMIDIDYFKEYNDYYGHLDGDYIISGLSEVILKHTLSLNAKAYRYGGDEFLIIVLNEDDDKIVQLGQDILKDVYDAKIPHVEVGIDGVVTLSIGIASFHKDYKIKSEDDLLKYADTALYTAKRKGRNRVAHSTYKSSNVSNE